MADGIEYHETFGRDYLVCGHCGALVHPDYVREHSDWHAKIALVGDGPAAGDGIYVVTASTDDRLCGECGQFRGDWTNGATMCDDCNEWAHNQEEREELE